MSVTARMKQYVAMRAVGMAEKQLTAAIHAPAKRNRSMAITAAINEL